MPKDQSSHAFPIEVCGHWEPSVLADDSLGELMEDPRRVSLEADQAAVGQFPGHFWMSLSYL
ncbi:hypothetical protein G6031_04790 [Dietzia sp. CQ4]|nr:hypothetical protein [Dietzia sp. CQ4]